MSLPSPMASFPDFGATARAAQARAMDLTGAAWAQLDQVSEDARASRLARVEALGRDMMARGQNTGFAQGLMAYGNPNILSQGTPVQAGDNINGSPVNGSSLDWQSRPNDSELARLIRETAQELQMPARDLGTIVSYETAGTFDPLKEGQITQWGRHRGLIQWGEDQARQYGVNWDDPVRSQLGRDGAVVRYFRDRGWKPGMGMLDAYSIVNAGSPGRYNATDENNGGTKGTVADKVRTQFDGHYRNADRLLGLG